MLILLLLRVYLRSPPWSKLLALVNHRSAITHSNASWTKEKNQLIEPGVEIDWTCLFYIFLSLIITTLPIDGVYQNKFTGRIANNYTSFDEDALQYPPLLLLDFFFTAFWFDFEWMLHVAMWRKIILQTQEA